MFQRFKELSEGKTAVLISHRFSSVRMADRILVLADGKVEAAGTHDELLAPGRPLCRALRAAGRRLQVTSVPPSERPFLPFKRYNLRYMASRAVTGMVGRLHAHWP